MNEYEDLTCKISINNKVVIIDFKKDSIIDEAIAKNIVQKRKELQNGYTYPLFIVDLGTKYVSDEALKIFSSRWCLEYTSALGVWPIRKPRNIINYYLSYLIMKLVTDIPVKRFKDQDSAEIWLNYQQELLNLKELHPSYV